VSKCLFFSIIFVTGYWFLDVPLLSKIDFPVSCYVTQTVFCSCIFGPKFEANKDLYIDIGHRMQKATVDAVNWVINIS